MSDECDVCCGSGRYPIIDKRGRLRYDIPCPECCGTGHAEPPEPDAHPDWPPPSTAALIHTMDDLKRHMQVEAFRERQDKVTGA